MLVIAYLENLGIGSWVSRWTSKVAVHRVVLSHLPLLLTLSRTNEVNCAKYLAQWLELSKTARTMAKEAGTIYCHL